MDDLGYLFAACAVVWGAIVVYVISLDRKSRRALRDLEALRRVLEK